MADMMLSGLGWPLAALLWLTIGLPVAHWLLGPVRRKNGGR